MSARDRYADAVTFRFGDSPAMADELLALVLAGTKTATCGALRDYGPDREPMPEVGRRDVVLDGKGRRAAVIETLELDIRRFDEVDAAFAFDEGEGDRSLADWRAGHEDYFTRNGGFSPDMQVVCERFRLVEVLGSPSHTGGCRCGAIRFEASAEPHHLSYCHCIDCRRASGAPVAAFVGFRVADVKFKGSTGATYGTPPVSRSFCAICGAPIAYTDARISDQIFFMLGAMDAPENYPPRVHGHVPRQLPFLHIEDGLPRTEGTTEPRPEDIR